ncbi:MAG: pseudouridine synthase [Acetivibrionales bacterium]
MAGIRLQKYLAACGLASRRKCEELISQGRVQVDGRVVTEQGFKIKGNEVIKVDGAVVGNEQKKVYILLNKPEGYISSVKDQFSRKTVLDLVDDVRERIYPVGRLDYDTSGLIILTNDGEFANMIMHPSHGLKKAYRAVISGTLSSKEVERLKEGIAVEDYITAPADVRVIKPGRHESVVEIAIHEGKNRQVRKMFESLGHRVIKLKRIAIGAVTINGLAEGRWRHLRKSEIALLYKAASKDDTSHR